MAFFKFLSTNIFLHSFARKEKSAEFHSTLWILLGNSIQNNKLIEGNSKEELQPFCLHLSQDFVYKTCVLCVLCVNCVCTVCVLWVYCVYCVYCVCTVCELCVYCVCI